MKTATRLVTHVSISRGAAPWRRRGRSACVSALLLAEANVSVVWAALGPAGLSSDSGLGGSTDGSTDVVFGAVVDSVTEEGESVCVCVCVCV